MSTKYKLIISLGFGAVVLPLQSIAASPTEMTKDDWLGKLKSVAPTVICQGFFEDASLKNRMEELKIDNAKCVSLIPASFDKCQTQYYSSLPATINKESASKWGHTIGECIGTDFATKYLVGTPPGSPDSSASNTTSSSANMSKETWFSQLKSLAPTMICQGFFDDASIKKKLDDRNIDNAKCITLIAPSFDKCQSEYYTNLPSSIDSEAANTWGRKIGECIGTDFAKKYLVSAPSADTTSATTTTSPSRTSAPVSTTPNQ
ncbi:hypothetical protein [Legionella jamestowniensis]|uniref:T2SS substrate NttA domain-containing protein n=1 Tax=Legionella jamestowniensis TaxID=455 RepID=A0A0W0UUR0_9GAMM|nr:hypothetical protein [Legionella jamestowniensis]KTD11318.1 hypothetical protein Ljam_0512 [Legionella jamestowniensis]OCH98821.1 hypothetical protein A8135_11000 [Legionella jamestowniensis]SFL69161.1 hypothetical protein SAMN02746073_1401 [Legionella jamestowniensis DSM 19215]